MFLQRCLHKHEFYKVPIETWDHLDFLWAKDAGEVLYSDVVRILKGEPVEILNKTSPSDDVSTDEESEESNSKS